MKIHNVVIFLLSIMLAVFILCDYISQKPITYNRANIEYAAILTSACYDAAKTISFEDGSEEAAWREEGKIEHTLDIFYTTLASAFHKANIPFMETISENTPFVILVDTDGFYLSVNACLDEYGNYVVPEDVEKLNSVTTLNTWTESYSGNIVRFFLTDRVEITLSDYQYVCGTRQDVYATLTDMDKTAGLEFLSDESLFREAQIAAITNGIENTINYILNTQTVNVASYNTGYNVTLPQLTGEDWSRMLKKPTIISFLQGKQELSKQMFTGTRMLNVYAYAAGELITSYPYFIVDNTYRCLRGLFPETAEDGSLLYTYEGIPIKKFYSSMKECAEAGAVPAVR